MSAYTTLRISRKAALKKYHQLILKEQSNSELENFLDNAFCNYLYNIQIVNDEDAEDDDYMIRLGDY